jgi:hypothetical protein
MDLVYQAIHAALLPVRLPDLPLFLDVFLEHIGRRNEKKRPKQTEFFFGQLSSLLSAAGAGATNDQSRAPPQAA